MAGKILADRHTHQIFTCQTGSCCRIKRKCWIHSIGQSRKPMGEFYSLFKELRRDKSNFFNFPRTSAASSYELHVLLNNVIQRQHTKTRYLGYRSLQIFYKIVLSSITQYRLAQLQKKWCFEHECFRRDVK